MVDSFQTRVGKLIIWVVSSMSLITLSSAIDPEMITQFDFSAADLVTNQTVVKLGPRRSFSTSNGTLHINAAAAARRGPSRNMSQSMYSHVGVIYAASYNFQDASSGSLAAFKTRFSYSLSYGGKVSASRIASSTSFKSISAGTWFAFVITPKYSTSDGMRLDEAFSVQFGDEETIQTMARLDLGNHNQANSTVRVKITPSLGTKISPSIEYNPSEKKLRVWVSYGNSESQKKQLVVSINSKALNLCGDHLYVGLVAGRVPALRSGLPVRSKAKFDLIQNLHGWRMSTSMSHEWEVSTTSNSSVLNLAISPSPDLAQDASLVGSLGGPVSGPNVGISVSVTEIDKSCHSFSCSKVFGIAGLAVGGAIIVLLLVIVLIGCCLYKKGLLVLKPSGGAAGNFPELLGSAPGPSGQRIFTYKELEVATKAFSPACLLGVGGSGSVYKGIIEDNSESSTFNSAGVAVKVISGNSMQGKKEFLSELSTISQVRHRNIVSLRGWCDSQAQNGKLLVVYDYMPHGSLDQLLFSKAPRSQLRWETRFQILLGVASALSYLHEEWEQQILHRDVKASNIMLDANYNARLGDFGVAKLVEHNQKNQVSTVLVTGTAGYIAPEMAYTRKSTDKTDVYSFGAVALEVACGRRPLEVDYPKEETLLLDWVWKLQAEDRLLDAVDKRLNDDYSVPQMLRVLQVGLLCSYKEPDSRPTMRQALHFLKGDVPLLDLPRTRPKAQGSVLPMTLADLLEEHSDYSTPDISGPVRPWS